MAENKSIGGLWEKTSKKGSKFFSGNIEIGGKKIKIVAFQNDKKGNEKAPDWRILESEEVEKTPF